MGVRSWWSGMEMSRSKYGMVQSVKEWDLDGQGWVWLAEVKWGQVG